MSIPLGREGVSRNADKRGQGEGERLAVSGHPFQCDLLKRGGQLKVILSLSSCVKD